MMKPPPIAPRPDPRAVVASPALARVVADVLSTAPRQVDIALPVIVPEDAPLPSVVTLAPWTNTVDAGGRMVRVAPVARSRASALAARFAATTASRLCRTPPAGHVWALYFDGVNLAVESIKPAAVAGAA